jgi:SAM-dependent methyltransferase
MRMSDADRFEEAYRAGGAPWDIGRPQRAIVKLAEAGEIRGSVLDVGCGTGENLLYLASRGHRPLLGVDLVPAAIARAREKAKERGLDVRLEIGDALTLETLGETFDTIVDSAVFHVFEDRERARYVASLERVLRPGGTYAALVFSDREPTDWGGPRRITKDEIHATFARGWIVRAIDEAIIESNLHPEGGLAWMARIERAL